MRRTSASRNNQLRYGMVIQTAVDMDFRYILTNNRAAPELTGEGYHEKR